MCNLCASLIVQWSIDEGHKSYEVYWGGKTPSGKQLHKLLTSDYLLRTCLEARCFQGSRVTGSLDCLQLSLLPGEKGEYTRQLQ